MTYLAVEGRKQIYFEHFAGTGTGIALVHGWAVESRCWDGVLPSLLATGRPVITIDQRCCGRSDRDFADVSISALAADVVGVVEHLGLSRIVLNGWSLGGAVAVAAAVALGSTLAGLALTGAATPRYTRAADFPHGGTVEDVQGTIAGIAADRATTFEGVAGAVFARPQSPAQLKFMAEMFMASSPRAYATLLDLATLDQRSLLPRIGAPTLLLHGADDLFVPLATARAAAALLPSATLSVYPDCGHAPFIEAQARYAGELTSFLAQCQQQP